VDLYFLLVYIEHNGDESPKDPIRVIFSQFMQSLYQIILFNKRQMLVFATFFSPCVQLSDV